MEIKRRIQYLMDEFGYFYNIDEVMGHLTQFDEENLSLLNNLTDEDLLDNIENVSNIIDLNEGEE
jgi:hypothetical protein